MRTLRSVLTVAAATVAFAGATIGGASAAPPVGCYGFPSIPDAFLCVTSFTPENAVPGATVDPDDSTVTIPEFCAGECYGPFHVPVPGVDTTPSGGPVLVVVYKGETYVVGGGGVPPLPLPSRENRCPGYPITGIVDTGPYVCVHNVTGHDGTHTWVGTCLGDECTLYELPRCVVREC